MTKIERIVNVVDRGGDELGPVDMRCVRVWNRLVAGAFGHGDSCDLRRDAGLNYLVIDKSPVYQKFAYSLATFRMM